MTTPENAKPAVQLDEIRSLAAQGQGIRSLTYPIGVRDPGLPGIITAVLPKKDDPRGTPHRYFAEGRLSSLARGLALLDMVTAETIVQGIEGQIVMIDMMPEAERTSEVRVAQARLAELADLTAALSAAGHASYAPRIAAEQGALERLLDAAGQPYVPEVVKSAEELAAEAEKSVDGLLGVARNMALGEPTEAPEAQVAAALAAGRKP